MLLAYSKRSDRGEHAVLHYPKAGNRLNCCRRLIKKDRGPFFIAYWGWGEGRGEIECPILFSAPPPPPPPPPSTFLFRSDAAGLAELHSLFFFCLIQIGPFNNF